jgi:sugar lactone lactonase YvrE
MARLGRFLALLVVALFLVALVLWTQFGGGQRLEDRTTVPLLPASALELVAALDYPPGNIAVSRTGRVFFSFHPNGNPPVQVAELVDGKPLPYPNTAFQKARRGTPYFQSVLALRIDRQDRLWVLDFAKLGFGQPRLLAFSLATGEMIHRYDFPSHIAGFFSMLNDFQVDPRGEKIYIAETSPILQTPAIIVYDARQRTSRRVLGRHPSVRGKPYLINAAGRDMTLLGLFPLRIGVDSIALDKRGEWLYYAPVNDDRLYRIATQDLNDESLTTEELAARVEDFAPKPLSDGLSMDVDDNVYITDIEHSAILSLGQDRRLTTLVKDPRLRWPDGLSFGQDGWLYVTCSALQHVLFRSTAHMQAHAPYQIFRFKPGPAGVPGH